MYSLNAPIPGEVRRLAADLHPDLFGFASIREEFTLVVKRLGTPAPGEFAGIESRARRVLAGAPPCEARIAGIDAFELPARGDGPVVYLAVESPGLREIHDRLAAEFGTAADIEGEHWVPHVTLARGGSMDRVERLTARGIEPITWTIDSLHFYDARHGERAGTVSLP